MREGSPGSPHTPLSTGCSQVYARAHMHARTHLYLKRRRLISDLCQDTFFFFFFFSLNGDVIPSVPSDAVSCPPQGHRSGTVSLQLPATSPTPRTACSGGTSPSLTFLRSATVRQREAEGLNPLL